MHRFFNPNRFLKIFSRILPAIFLITFLCLASGLYFSLFDSPADYQQGEAVRLMYLHVPTAWISLLLYSILCAFSAARLIWKNPFADILSAAIAPIGLLFTAFCLATGAIWGKPIWGSWWVWDARLTSVLILFFQYLAYIMLAAAIEAPELRGKITSIFALIGGINLPIIKFSVEWWNTLHQPASLIRSGGSAIDAQMLLPLLLMFFGLLGYSMILWYGRIVTLYQKNKSNQKRR